MIAVAVVIMISLGIFFVVTAETRASGCLSNSDCEFSLCDCKCHKAGETPEEQKGIFCGINCKDTYGVSGCECSYGECVEI